MAVAVFIPVEETRRLAQKGVRDLFWVGWVEALRVKMTTEVSEVVEVLDSVEKVLVEVEVEEGTPGEAVEIMKMIPVEEEEDLTM